MGVVDLVILDDIHKTIKELENEHNWGFKFKKDLGTFETAIEFTAIGYHHPPKSKNWDEAKAAENEIKCPDFLDYMKKTIIEYEEEPKPGKRGGKMGQKGHSEESERDQHRDQLYRIGGFKLFKIWESAYKDGSYKNKLFHFFADVYTGRKIKRD